MAVQDPIRLVLADDHTLFRQGLRRLLELTPEFTVIGEAANGEDAVHQVQTLRPDVVIMDVSMPGGGLNAARQVRLTCPEVGIVMLTMHEDQEYLMEALKVGAHGYLVKDVDSANLVDAIRAAREGRPYLHPKLAGLALMQMAQGTAAAADRPRAADGGALTDREVEVLRVLVRGGSNREIARTLFITEKTAKNHLTHIFGKLGVTDRTQAALAAVRLGLVGLEEEARGGH